MARIEIDPNYSSPTFSRATASTDLFKKEDVQALAAAISTHVHDGAGKGLAVAPGAATIPGSALANGSVTLAKLAADSVDSSKIVDGTIATADLANASVTNAKLASDTARANLLTNGGFEIWQRGVGPFTAGVTFTADRWTRALSGADTLVVQKSTGVVDAGSAASASCVFTLSGGTNTALYQSVEDFGQLKGRVVTVSIRVQCNAASAARLWMYGGGAGARVYGTVHTGGGTWQTLTLTATVDPAAVAPPQFGIEFNASCTAYLDNAMLVVGSVAADYAPLHPADDLARCLRYYEGRTGAVASGYNGSTTAAEAALPFSTKALVPTITFAAPSNYLLRIPGGQFACTSLSTGTNTVSAGYVAANVASGLTAGQGTLLIANSPVVMEANP